MKFKDKITGKDCPSKELCISCPEHREPCLRPLYNAKVIVHYPFFANTYLLPFFYSQLIDSNEKKELIKKVGWGNEELKNTINEIKEWIVKDNSIHLFYAAKHHKIDESSDNLICKPVDFCKYYPRFIFLDFSIDIFRKLYGEDKISTYNTISDFLTEHFLNIIPIFSVNNEKVKSYIRSRKIKCIRIFSDTIDEAKRLSILVYKDIRKSGFNDINIEVVSEGLTSSLIPDDEIFNIYFYSAPHNILFLKKKYQYLPFQLQSTTNFNDFETSCYLLCQKNREEDLVNIINSLKKFFPYVFWKAKEIPEHFFSITQSFNFNAAIKHPSIVFENEYSFAKCLSLHVEPNETTDFEQKIKLSKRYIFESLFNFSHNDIYNKQRERLLENNIKQIYSLITMNYMMECLDKIHHFKDRSFSSICEALLDTTFNRGFYNMIFHSFIVSQVNLLIKTVNKDLAQNPIHDAIDNWDIQKEKICQRLVHETKHYFNRVLIKECQAEEVFFVDMATKKFEIEITLANIYNSDLNEEEKSSIEHLQKIFDKIINICSNHYEDIVTSDNLGLSSIFRTNIVKDLILSKVAMTPAIYTQKKVVVKMPYFDTHYE